MNSETLKVKDLMADGATVAEDGSVKATFHYVESFPEFSTVLEEQSGYYFYFKLATTGEEMTLKKNGVSRPDKTNMPFDPEIIVRLDGKTDTLEIEVDGKPYITLNFKDSTFEPDNDPAGDDYTIAKGRGYVSSESTPIIPLKAKRNKWSGAADAPVLSGLTIGALELSPAFNPNVTGYTAETTNSTNKVKAVCDDEAAVIEIKLNDNAVENNSSVTWDEGENTLTVDVTGADNQTMRYTVTVTKS